MIYLIEAALEQGAQRIVDQAAESGRSHGVMVEIDPLWWHAYFHFICGFDVDSIFSNLVESNNHLHSPGLSLRPLPAPLPININWRPKNWDTFTNNRSNLIIKVLLEPGAEQIFFQYEGPLQIYQEQRPIPVLQAIDAKLPISPLQGGVSIGTGAADAGTLGGILRSKTGTPKTFYGLSCGHVIGTVGQDVKQPAQCDHSSYTVIGKCVYTYRPATKSTSLCTRYDNTTLKFFSMDVSLIELSGTPDMEIINIGAIDGLTVASQLHPNLAVSFNGRTSGNRTLVLGAIGITNNITDTAGDKYCFEHLVELKDANVANLGTSPPCQAGDSGAWVIVQKSITRMEWGGMLIGGDGVQTGYLLMAEKINEELIAQGYNLDVY